MHFRHNLQISFYNNKKTNKNVQEQQIIYSKIIIIIIIQILILILLLTIYNKLYRPTLSHYYYFTVYCTLLINPFNNYALIKMKGEIAFILCLRVFVAMIVAILWRHLKVGYFTAMNFTWLLSPNKTTAEDVISGLHLQIHWRLFSRTSVGKYQMLHGCSAKSEISCAKSRLGL